VSSDFHIKREIRILGIDDSVLLNEKVMVIGAVYRGGDWMDGVLHSYITKDGLDATAVICRMVLSSKHYSQIRVIMLDGITYAGFNVIDTEKLYRETGIPLIVFMRSYPNFEKLKSALKYFQDGEKRWKIMEKAGEIYSIAVEKGRSSIYILKIGVSLENVGKIIRFSSTRGNIPEPLRVAHLIATGIILGESRGKA
jgi:endonuclease V-like protein UPF0215 family